MVQQPCSVLGRTRRKTPDDAVEAALLKKAKGYFYKQQDSCKCKTTEYSESGKKLQERETLEMVEVKKYMPPDYAAITFWLKARRPERWGSAEGGASAPVPIIDNVPPAPILTAEEMAALAALRGGNGGV